MDYYSDTSLFAQKRPSKHFLLAPGKNYRFGKLRASEAIMERSLRVYIAIFSELKGNYRTFCIIQFEE
jgi:hypothetical protein